MTPTAFKYMQLEETKRSNLQQEALGQQRNKIETAKAITGAITDALKLALPFGFDIVKWKTASPDQLSTAIDALEKEKKRIGWLNDDQFKLLQSLIKYKKQGVK